MGLIKQLISIKSGNKVSFGEAVFIPQNRDSSRFLFLGIVLFFISYSKTYFYNITFNLIVNFFAELDALH